MMTSRDFNDGAHVELFIPFRSHEQLQHLFDAQASLRKAGVRFSTGFGGGGLDWKLGWSLMGARVNLLRNTEQAQEWAREHAAKEASRKSGN